ncbi:MAG: hypothetical protein PHI12_11275 [Dehalococcoidales bacterium]|nr:hypothetical protein [Dehalococcoidales bacterium]
MGKMKLKLPKCPVSLQMNEGRVTIKCPHCKQVMYDGIGSPHPKTNLIIAEHVKKLCDKRPKEEAKKELTPAEATNGK